MTICTHRRSAEHTGSQKTLNLSAKLGKLFPVDEGEAKGLDIAVFQLQDILNTFDPIFPHHLFYRCVQAKLLHKLP